MGPVEWIGIYLDAEPAYFLSAIRQSAAVFFDCRQSMTSGQ